MTKATTDKAQSEARARLDKWLWAARFFKTRSQATQAVNGGKVHVNEKRAKAGHGLKCGDSLSVNKREQHFELRVLALSEKRGPAVQAQALYEETPESIELREQAAMRRKQAHNSMPVPDGRPDKRERRELRRFKHSE